MKEIALFGVKYFEDGTRDEKLISCAASNHEWEQGIEMCENLPVDEYDGFLFIDDDTGRWFRYDLGKPPRRKRRRNYKQIFQTLISKGVTE